MSDERVPLKINEDKLAVLAEQSKYLLHAAEQAKGAVDAKEKKITRAAEIKKMSICVRPFVMVHDKIIDWLENSSGLDPKLREQLNPTGIRFISLAAKACFAAILVAFTYTGYASDQATKYISLDSTTSATDSSSNFRECLTVPYAINAVFSVDTNGIWSGASAYVPGKGKLKFIFNNFEKSADSYSTFMSDVKSNIKTYVASGATSRNVMLNLAYFMSWTYEKSDTTTEGATVKDYITFKGDPAYVFDRNAKTAVLGAAEQQCYAVPTINYDRATAGMTIEYDYGTPTVTGGTPVTPVSVGSGYFGSNQGISKGIGCCPEFTNAYEVDSSKCLLPPGDYGYDRGVDKEHFLLKYNLWSLSTAFAVNQGIVPYKVLNIVQTDLTKSSKGCYSLNPECTTSGCATSGTSTSTSPYTLIYDGSASTCSITVGTTKYYIEARMDSRYPGMSPIYCLVTKLNSDSAKMCFIRVGKTFVLPYMNHMGTSAASGDFFDFQSWCSCSETDFSTIASTTTSKPYTQVTTTASSIVITMNSVSDASEIREGYAVTGADIPTGTTVSSVNSISKTVTLSSSATATTTTGTVTFTTSLKNFYTNNGGISRGTPGKFFASTLGASSGYCNMFDLLHGLVVIKGSKIDTVLGQFVETLAPYSKDQVNAMASLSGWTSLKVGGNAGAQIPKTIKLLIAGPPSGCTNAAGCDVSFTSMTKPYQILVEGKMSASDIIDSGGLVGNYVYYNGYSETPAFFFPSNTVITAVEILVSSICSLTLSPTTDCKRYKITISNKPIMNFEKDGQQTGGKLFLNTYSVGQTQATDVYAATGIAYGPYNSAIVNAFSWCTPTSVTQGGKGNCAVLAVNTVDTSDQRINEEGGVTVSSSCTDDFTMADTVWLSSDGTTGIQKVPPTSLFNDYYECYNTITKSTLIAFGAGSGSAGSITPVFVMLLLATFGKFFVRHAADAVHHISNAGHALSMRIDDAYHQVMGDTQENTREKVDEHVSVEMVGTPGTYIFEDSDPNKKEGHSI